MQENFFNFVGLSKLFLKLKFTHMGKGDKKTKRGKIVLGTYGVRRRRKISFKAAVKANEEKNIRVAAQKKEKAVAEVKEKAAKEKAPVKEKPVKEKAEKAEKPEKAEKEVKTHKEQKEQKPKKEKKSE